MPVRGGAMAKMARFLKRLDARSSALSSYSAGQTDI